MTLEEARRELGVTAGTRGQDLKRAYLRRVKVSPPDRDPEGFARARSAYELLNSLSIGRPSRPLVSPQAEQRPALDAASSTASPAPQSEPPQSEPPQSEPPQSEPPQPDSLGAEQFANPASSTTAGAPDVDFGLLAILELEAAGKHDEATSVLKPLAQYIDGYGLGMSLGSDTATRLGLALELAQLPPEANAVRRSVGMALLEEQPGGARAELNAFAQANPEVAKRLFSHLDDKAPLLRQFFFDSLLTKSDRKFIVRAALFGVLVIVVGLIDNYPTWYRKPWRLLRRLLLEASQWWPQ